MSSSVAFPPAGPGGRRWRARTPGLRLGGRGRGECKAGFTLRSSPSEPPGFLTSSGELVLEWLGPFWPARVFVLSFHSFYGLRCCVCLVTAEDGDPGIGGSRPHALGALS
eukprot:1429971-Alexandrium_andersonii.AAC.1